MARPLTFADLIDPLTWDQFRSKYWARTIFHHAGKTARFTSLLSWEDLNAILEWHCPPQPQVRLSFNGKSIDPRQYIDGNLGSLKLNVGGLIANLSRGASLIVDQVQEVVPNVGKLAEELQDIFQGIITANLYAGWGNQHGFDLHWDIADLFVLQIYGRKRWKVYRPTRPYPLTNDIKDAPKPTEPPVFDGTINDGDVLHVPRGWWHMAYPLNEPSLHLTFGIESLHGADFVRWWAQKTLREPDVRKNIPLDSSTLAISWNTLGPFCKSWARSSTSAKSASFCASAERPAEHVREFAYRSLLWSSNRHGRKQRAFASRLPIAC